MANYAVVDYKTDEGPLVDVIAAMEVKMETLDDTNNPFYLVTVEQIANGVFVGVIIYKG